jgi:hypothetical protein
MQTDIRDTDCRVKTEEYSHALDSVATDWTYTFMGG